MAKVIMIQGTTSNAGKSFLTAALCRIFKQDGYSVAPFKSQNMALNSYITEEGLEMGRAQVMQAEAAGIAPSVRMNPILLKPTSDVGSQVIVNGIPLGTMPAKEYFRRKQELVPDILEAYHSLAHEHDIIVIEGAGSPAEINLKQNDIVNMGLAQLVDAPVLLCGDIDRGGVFASLYGTVALLEPQEQDRIKGLVINNFRGDKTILDPGTQMLEELTGKPVVGVIPHLEVDLDDEDSLSSRFTQQRGGSALDIAVIRLPRISNFTDFNSLERMEQVSLRYVHTAAQLGNPDVVILPGTKNTIQDLLWLRQQGLEAAILKAASNGIPVVGICGGYQMMGNSLSDPEGIEGGGTIRGMGLLDGDTLFAPEKARTQVNGKVSGAEGIFAALNGVAFSGYEIHMGQTKQTRPFAQLTGQEKTKTADGSVRGNCWGSYVHGIFDRSSFVEGFVSCLLRANGLEDCTPVQDWKDYKETQYDLLAAGVRQSIDLPAIYRILEGKR